VYYAGALERPELHDLEPTPDIAHPTGGWPVGYDAFKPYFRQAEDMLEIRGTPDPLSRDQEPCRLREPVDVSDGERAMIADWEGIGLHPYRQHLAIRNLPGCMNCVGRKCPRPCKMDGRSAGVEPALETGHAALLDRCAVEELLEDNGRVSALRARRDGVQAKLRARAYVLAGGALNSPRLLLASRGSSDAGLANSSGWVGRGLMFHMNEMFAVWPRREERFEGAARSISLRDLYVVNGQRLGLVQSLGVEASYGMIAQHLKTGFDRTAPTQLRKLRGFMNIPAFVGAKVLGNAKVLVGLLEDLPYAENRILIRPEAPDEFAFDYTISDELLQRRRLFRKEIKRAFAGRRLMLLRRTPELNFAHGCGTLRFGTDPKTSVFDADCKAHDLENLYLADASFFPTSTGVNPSLTIAANALRVADTLGTRLQTLRETP
jgi:choline dehydrogenase-like flavoprotein